MSDYTQQLLKNLENFPAEMTNKISTLLSFFTFSIKYVYGIVIIPRSEP